MPRKARILVPDAPHLIIQHAHQDSCVFMVESDYQYYLDNLSEMKNELGLRVYAYCLLPSCAYLIVNPGNEHTSISTLMKHLAGRQTRYINRMENRNGSLWAGRYKVSAIQEHTYLLKVCRYVELSPIRHRVMGMPEMYRWSSYLEKSGLKPSRIVDRDNSFMCLGESEHKCMEAYSAFMAQRQAADTDSGFISEAIERNQLIGGDEFVDVVEEKTGQRIESRKPGRPLKHRRKRGFLR